MWAPGLHKLYSETLSALKTEHPNLEFPRDPSVFPAATYNLGPSTATYPHQDFANLAYSWCAITALGFFNHETGGHLVLRDLKLVIEFPPGSTILIPSSILSHSNIAVDNHECRYSFTQYAAGSLFRWVDNGFCMLDSLSPEEQAERRAVNVTQWQKSLSLYRTWADY